MHDNKKRRETTNKHGKKTTKHEENGSQPQLITSKVKAPLKTQQKCKEQHTATNKTTPKQLVVGPVWSPRQQSIKISRFFKTKNLTNQIRVLFLNGDRARSGRAQKLVTCM